MAAIGRVLLMDKGAYSGSTVYNQLDWVRDNGASWVCKVDGTVGIAPPTLPTTLNANWTLMAQDGSVSGAVDWFSGVNNKPFEYVGSGLTVDPSKTLKLDTNLLTGSNISYDNSGSGATSNNVQDAIDELFGGGGHSGHEMIPATADNTDVDTIANMEYADASQNKVVNAYTIQKYSNIECMTIFTTAAQGTDTIGSWNDTWETDRDRQNWLWHSALYGILDDDEVEASMVFDVQTNETVSVYAYRVDDEVYIEATNTTGKNPKAEGWYESDGQTPPTYTLTNDTSVQAGKTYYMLGGAIAIKLNSKIQNPSGVKIGLNLKRQRTLVELFREIS